MRLRTLTLFNFRCFGPEPTRIDFIDITTIVGTNGAGKTAILQSLMRLFGPTQHERSLKRSDFYVPIGVDPESLEEVDLWIEAEFVFSELQDQLPAPGIAVPEFFRQMIVAAPGELPYCRIRLEGTWVRSNLHDGEIEEKLNWLCSAEQNVPEDLRLPVQAAERARIRVFYVPAVRDPARQLQHASGTLLSRLLQAVEWSDQIKQTIATAFTTTTAAFQTEEGVRLIQGALNTNWSRLHDATSLSNVQMRFFAQQFEEVLKQVEMAFAPGEEGGAHQVDRLSDGLRSLFYLTLIGTVFDVERSIQEADPGAGDTPLSVETLRTPALTLFAVEEPENHLSPHFLGRTLRLLQRIAASPGAQVVLTSHSPAILGRVEPAVVRHVRYAEGRGTVVSAVRLPNQADEAYKFVKEAVRSHPELYFSRAVVLCEGDSEELVLPRLAAAMGVAVDESCVSVVPLGGRHVNHFWRLLHDLGIPHLTLLDLDRERFGGGWGRVKYAIQQLLAVGAPRDKLLRVRDARSPYAYRILSERALDSMHTRPLSDLCNLAKWIKRLEEYNVFFSQPLDLDFTMLRTFGHAYRAATTGEGPRLPSLEDNPEGYQQRLEQARHAVLKASGLDGATFTEHEREDFVWYHYLFLGRGKPVTHLLAVNEISPDQLASNAPLQLKRIVWRLEELLGMSAVEDLYDGPN